MDNLAQELLNDQKLLKKDFQIIGDYSTPCEEVKEFASFWSGMVTGATTNEKPQIAATVHHILDWSQRGRGCAVNHEV